MEWQPMETAPRDGTWVLLSGGEAGFDDYKKEIRNWPQCVAARWQEDDWDIDGGHWAMCYWDGAWRSTYYAPSHWMLLPPAPEAA